MSASLTTYLDALVDTARDIDSGEYAPLREAPAPGERQPFGIAVVTAGGQAFSAGDDEQHFALQSISKAIAYAMALEEHGFGAVARMVDMEPSGESYDTISVEDGTGRPDNPMINAGAMTIHALIGGPDATAQERDGRILDTFSALAGRRLEIDRAGFEHELASADRNLAIAHMLRALEILPDDPRDVVEGYLRQCAITVTVTDLARMGACLANGGRNPDTGEQIFSRPVVRQALSVMMTCGMYDSAGDWVSQVGIPAKSGISGGILGVMPGRGGIATFGPRLDEHGTSVRGQLAFERLSDDLGIHFVDALHEEDRRWEDAIGA